MMRRLRVFSYLAFGLGVLVGTLWTPTLDAQQQVIANSGTNLNTSALALQAAVDGLEGSVDGLEALLAGGLPAALGAGGGVKVDGSGTALPVTANAGTNLNTSALALEATLGNVLTSANFAAAFGTAGTSDSQVMSVQGIASGTALPISGSVSCSNCTGSGASDVDNSTFTFGTDSVAPAGFAFDDVAPAAITENNVGLARMSGNRVAYNIIRDAAGSERGANVTAANELLVELGAGAASIGTLGANSGVDIGDVTLTAGSASIGTLGANSGVDIGDVTLTAGAASIGTLGANSGVDIGDVTINNAAGASAVNVQDGGNSLTIDGTVTITDGAGALNVIVDSSATLTVTDGAGALNVICDSGCGGSGGTSLADDADFTDGTTAGTPIGGVAESAAPSTVTEGDFGWAAITLNRALKVALYGADGTAWTQAVDWTVSSAIGTTGPGQLLEAKDFDGAALPLTAAAAEGDAIPRAGSLYGVSYTMLVSEDGSLQYGTATTPLVVGDGTGALNVICDSGCAGGTQYAEDAVHASGNTGTLTLGVRNDAGTALAADGDNIPLMFNSSGALYVATGTVTVTDGAGAMNVIVDSSASLTVTDGAGALNVIVDSGTVTTVSTVTNLSQFSGAAIPMTTTQADDLANTLDGLNITGFTYVFDGSTWDRWTGAITGTVTANAGTNLNTSALLTSTNFSDAFGVAGTADTQVMSVQGIASMTPLLVGDGTGAFNVICDSGCAGGTQYAVDTALGATPTVTLAGAIRDDALSALTPVEGDAIGLRVDANGALWVIPSGSTTVTDGSGALNVIIDSSATLTVTDGAGAMNVIVDSGTITTVSTVTTLSQLGGIALPIEDAAETAAGVGIYAMSVRRDTAASSAGTTGDNATLNTDANGLMWARVGAELPAGTQNIGDVDIVSGTLTTVSTVTTLSQLGGVALPIEDAAETAAGVGIYAMGVRRDTLASSAGATGDNTMASYTATGAMWVSTPDPCSYGAKLQIPISQTTGTQLITGTASNRTYICSVNVVAAAAQNISIVSGTGTVCATSPGGMFGGTTAATGWNFGANGGISFGNGEAWIAKSDTDADNICLLQSGSAQISGNLTYVVAVN